MCRERLQRMRDYIDAHLADRFTLTDLAGDHRPRYPFKPAVPSESGQVAQNLA